MTPSIHSRHRRQYHPYAPSFTSPSSSSFSSSSSSSSSSSFSHMSMTSSFLLLLFIIIFTSLPSLSAQPSCGTTPKCACDQNGCYTWAYTYAACNYPCAPYNPDSPSLYTLPISQVKADCVAVVAGVPTKTSVDYQLCINTVGNSNNTSPYCNTQPCQRNINNSTGRSWGDCNYPCAFDGNIPSQERRAADCVANLNSPSPTIVLQSYCPPPTLSDTRKNCNTQPCKWSYTVGACSVQCGPGQATNTAQCQNQTGTNVAETYCASLPKQNNFVPCNEKPCTVWNVVVPNFPRCNTSCDEYPIYRVPICYRDGVALPAERFRECCNSDQTTVDCDTIKRSDKCPGEKKYCPTTIPPTIPPTQPPCHSTNNPCSSNGICELDGNGAGICRCINGYSGVPSCDKPPSIDTVTVSTQTSEGTLTSVTPGTELYITWTHTSSMERVALWLQPFSGVPIYINMSIPVTSSTMVFTWTIPNTIPGDISYTVTVSYNATITKSSTSFIINQPVCAAKCMNGGTCVKGVCSCLPGWTGTTCSQTTCPNCGMYGTCTAGKCVCKDGFKGDNCQIPPACNIPCANGAISSSCQCQCTGYWMGANCSMCNMPSSECFSGGKPNKDCNACDCPTIPDAKDVTWTGDKCQLAQLNVRAKVVIPEAQRTEKDSQDFGRLFVQELTSVIGWSRDRVILTKIDVAGNIDMTFIAETSSSITNIVQVLNNMVKTKSDVSTSPTSRTMGQGYATSKLDSIRDPPFTTSAVIIIPPTPPPATPKPSSSTAGSGPTLGSGTSSDNGSSSSFPIIYVGIGAGALVLIIVIILSILCWRRHRQGYGFSQNVTKLGAQGVSVEIPKELQRGHAQTMANFELSPLASANPKYLASTTGTAFQPPPNQYAIPGPPPEPEGGYGYNGTNGGNEWEERTDEQGYQYWYNNNTGESTWDSPY